MTMTSFKMMDIDHTLAADKTGGEVRRLESKLEEGRVRVRARVDGGVSAVEHRRLSLALGAFEAASGLLPKLWQAQHR